MRFRYIIVWSLTAALAANLTSFVAWEVADGAEDGTYFLLRVGLVMAALAGAAVAMRTRGAWVDAVAAGLFCLVVSAVLTWVPVTVLVLLNPPS